MDISSDVISWPIEPVDMTSNFKSPIYMHVTDLQLIELL